MSEEKNKNNNVQLFIILGWISTALSVLFIPILFGAGGVIFGYLLRTKGQVQHGTIMIIAAVACAILGFLLGMASVGY